MKKEDDLREIITRREMEEAHISQARALQDELECEVMVSREDMGWHKTPEVSPRESMQVAQSSNDTTLRKHASKRIRNKIIPKVAFAQGFQDTQSEESLLASDGEREVGGIAWLKENLSNKQRELRIVGAEMRSYEEQAERSVDLLANFEIRASCASHSEHERELQVRMHECDLRIEIAAAKVRAEHFESMAEDFRAEPLASEEQVAQALAAQPTTARCLEWMDVVGMATLSDSELMSLEASLHTMTQRVMREHIHRDMAAATSTGCVVCMAAPCDTVILDCGHLSVCHSCAQALRSCPVCRQHVREVRRVFTS